MTDRERWITFLSGACFDISVILDGCVPFSENCLCCSLDKHCISEVQPSVHFPLNDIYYQSIWKSYCTHMATLTWLTICTSSLITHTHTHTHSYTYHTSPLAHTHARTRMHTHTRTHTHTHTHTHMHRRAQALGDHHISVGGDQLHPCSVCLGDNDNFLCQISPTEEQA